MFNENLRHYCWRMISNHVWISTGKATSRRSRLSSSGRESREGDSEASARRHKKRRSEDRGSRSNVTTGSGGLGGIGASSNAASSNHSVSSYLWNFLGKFNPYAAAAATPCSSKQAMQSKPAPRKVDPEEAAQRRLDIEKNRTERQRRRKQERMVQTERFIKSMRLLHLNDRSALTKMSGNTQKHAKRTTTENDDEEDVNDENEDDEDYTDEEEEGEENFKDFTFHLYRQTAPIFKERLQHLEQKLAVRKLAFFTVLYALWFDALLLQSLLLPPVIPSLRISN